MSSWWFQPIPKNISQIGTFPQVGVKIKKSLKPPPSYLVVVYVDENSGITPQYHLPATKTNEKPGLLQTHHLTDKTGG